MSSLRKIFLRGKRRLKTSMQDHIKEKRYCNTGVSDQDSNFKIKIIQNYDFALLCNCNHPNKLIFWIKKL